MGATYDHDYEGYDGYIWQMCPMSCDMCEQYGHWKDNPDDYVNEACSDED